MIVFVAWLLAGGILAAQPFESRNAVDNTLPLGGASVTLHSEWRVRHHFSQFSQARVAPILRLPVGRFRLAAGYYLTGSRAADAHWEHYDRVFGSVEAPLYEGANAFSTRSTIEWFHGTDVPGPTRFRQNLRYERTVGQWRPAGYVELFIDPHGVSGLRPALSVVHPLSSGAELECGYYYELRRQRTGSDRQALFTRLRFAWRRKR